MFPRGEVYQLESGWTNRLSSDLSIKSTEIRSATKSVNRGEIRKFLRKNNLEPRFMGWKSDLLGREGLLLIHLYPSWADKPGEILAAAREIFPQTAIPSDGDSYSIAD